MNRGWTYQEKVDSLAIGQTLLDYYCQRYPHSNQTEWKTRINNGQILVDGQPSSPQQILKRHQQLTYLRSPWVEADVPLNFEVLYEDADLWIIAKPSGLPVLPGGGFLEHTLLHLLQRKYPQEKPTPIHRLGRGTSGLMLIARSALARSVLSQDLRDRRLQKIYRALIGPCDLPEQFTITTAIGKIAHPQLGYIYGATANGKTAESQGQILERTETQTLLQVRIITGRPHQIRIHLASIGYPLLGDPLYAIGGIPHAWQNQQNKPIPSDCGYHLHAHQIGFYHPRSQQYLSFICPPPPILETSLQLILNG